MGARHSKRSMDVTTTPKKEGAPAEGGDAAAVGDGKLERIDEADVKPTTNGTAPHTESADEAKDKDSTTEKEEKKEAKEGDEVKVDEAKAETPADAPAEGGDATTPSEGTPTSPTSVTSPDTKESKKKEKTRKKWSFRTISFGKKDKTKPVREDAPKNGDVSKEEPLTEGGEEAEAAATSPTEEKSAAASPATETAVEAVPAAEVAKEVVEEKPTPSPSSSSTDDKKEAPTSSSPAPTPTPEAPPKEDEKTENKVEVSQEAQDVLVEPMVDVKSSQPIVTASIIERKTIEDFPASHCPSSPPPTPIDPSPLQQAQTGANASALAEALKLPAETSAKNEAENQQSHKQTDLFVQSEEGPVSVSPDISQEIQSISEKVEENIEQKPEIKIVEEKPQVIIEEKIVEKVAEILEIKIEEKPEEKLENAEEKIENIETALEKVVLEPSKTPEPIIESPKLIEEPAIKRSDQVVETSPESAKTPSKFEKSTAEPIIQTPESVGEKESSTLNVSEVFSDSDLGPVIEELIEEQSSDQDNLLPPLEPIDNSSEYQSEMVEELSGDVQNIPLIVLEALNAELEAEELNLLVPPPAPSVDIEVTQETDGISELSEEKEKICEYKEIHEEKKEILKEKVEIFVEAEATREGDTETLEEKEDIPPPLPDSPIPVLKSTSDLLNFMSTQISNDPPLSSIIDCSAVPQEASNPDYDDETNDDSLPSPPPENQLPTSESLPPPPENPVDSSLTPPRSLSPSMPPPPPPPPPPQSSTNNQESVTNNTEINHRDRIADQELKKDQSIAEPEAPVEKVSEPTTESVVEEAPKSPVPQPIEVSAPAAPVITEDVASVTKAIEEIDINEKAVAAAVNENIESVNSSEIIADMNHQNTLNE